MLQAAKSFIIVLISIFIGLQSVSANTEVEALIIRVFDPLGNEIMINAQPLVRYEGTNNVVDGEGHHYQLKGGFEGFDLSESNISELCLGSFIEKDVEGDTFEVLNISEQQTKYCYLQRVTNSEFELLDIDELKTPTVLSDS